MISLKNKRILVTGAHGFLGTHLLRNLVEKRGVPKENISAPRSSECDLRVWENCVRITKQQDIVIHLAALAGGIGLNLARPGELFYDNIAMGTQLMEAARQAGVEKFVGIATICAYPKFTPVPFKEENLWIGYPEETNAAYGLAKKMLLVQAQAYRTQYSFNAITLFPINMYGPHDNFDLETSHVIPALIRKVATAKEKNAPLVEVWGSGKPTREFLFVEDSAEGILLATERYSKSDPVNLGVGSEISIRDLVTLIANLMEYHGEIHWDTAKPDGQPRRSLDVTRAEREFGFRAQTPLASGLMRTMDWYLENGSYLV